MRLTPGAPEQTKPRLSSAADQQGFPGASLAIFTQKYSNAMKPEPLKVLVHHGGSFQLNKLTFLVTDVPQGGGLQQVEVPPGSAKTLSPADQVPDPEAHLRHREPPCVGGHPACNKKASVSLNSKELTKPISELVLSVRQKRGKYRPSKSLLEPYLPSSYRGLRTGDQHSRRGREDRH